MEVLLESFADLNLNKSSARFCTCTPVQLFVACRCLCCLICWSLIKHHTSLFCLVEYSASLVLSSLTASRKAPSWDSWVSVGSSDLHGHMCPHSSSSFLYFSILMATFFHPNLLPLVVTFILPTSSWPLPPTSSSHPSIYPSSCFQTRHIAPQPLTFCSKNKAPQNRNPNKMTNSIQRRLKVAGTMKTATPRATPSPAGTMQKQLRVRRAGTTTKRTLLSRTLSPTGTTAPPQRHRVAGVTLEKTR